ncbi:helix-turn-helix domain-containing protein [Streptomyces sp. NPDC087859]|uniref:helix-turn-helix domain-containing protein n=1 Tax=Streptomyces sp. NPDC087859 TaxID=3365812 RepID=UPI00380D8AC8
MDQGQEPFPDHSSSPTPRPWRPELGAVGRIAAYDERGTDLVGTFTACFARSRNVAGIVRALHIHTDTLLKRIERIGGLLGQAGSGPTTPWDSSSRSTCTTWPGRSTRATSDRSDHLRRGARPDDLLASRPVSRTPES